MMSKTHSIAVDNDDDGDEEDDNDKENGVQVPLCHLIITQNSRRRRRVVEGRKN